MTVAAPDSPRRSVELFSHSEVTPDDVRAALFTKRRPLVKPLFSPDRPTGVPIVFVEAQKIPLSQRIMRFFGG